MLLESKIQNMHKLSLSVLYILVMNIFSEGKCNINTWIKVIFNYYEAK